MRPLTAGVPLAFVLVPTLNATAQQGHAEPAPAEIAVQLDSRLAEQRAEHHDWRACLDRLISGL